ncbi:MAG: hypothetical protein ACOY7T_08205 [Pseudomonadota bacterium]
MLIKPTQIGGQFQTVTAAGGGYFYISQGEDKITLCKEQAAKLADLLAQWAHNDKPENNRD